LIGALKPEYLFQWRVAVRRLYYALASRPTGVVEVAFPWGVRMRVDPDESIGRSLCDLGIYDLPVSEVLWRLATPGMLAIDAGSNIGYVSLLLASAGGSTSRIVAFEPHPEVVESLAANVELNRGRPWLATLEIRQMALGSRAGTARLVWDESFPSNRGTARIGEGSDSGCEVSVTSIDEAFPESEIRILKVDVEGHELEVLRGAERALVDRRIQFIVFEAHDEQRSGVLEFLSLVGYRVVAISRSLLGLRLESPDASRGPTSYEPPSYLAFPEETDLPASLFDSGWLCLAAKRP